MNPNELPPVSVIIPARNAAATLADTLESVLAQDYAGGIEVIVADGRVNPVGFTFFERAVTLTTSTPLGTGERWR